MLANFDLYSQQIDLSTFKIKVSRVEIAGRDVNIQEEYYIDYEDNALEFDLTTDPQITNSTYKYRIIESSFEGDRKSVL